MSLLFPLQAERAWPAFFLDPFAEHLPHPSAQAAANEVKAALTREAVCTREGKMFGVLVVRTNNGQLGYLKAFSGMLSGRWNMEGFVPPAFDVQLRESFERAGAREVARLQQQCQTLQNNSHWLTLQREENALLAQHKLKQEAMATRHRRNRTQRREQRNALESLSPAEREAALHALAQQSRADKAEQRQVELGYQAALHTLQTCQQPFVRRHRASVRLLHMVCRHLMRRIHDCYLLQNAAKETKSLRALFAPAEPPSGAGDCAAPKLLAFAQAEGLEPLALAEFWWGPPPATGGRVAGVFYPACKGKCGPLLPFMLRGLPQALPVGSPSQAQSEHHLALEVVYEDAFVLVVNKPPGLLSVPGRGDDKQDSVLKRLQFCLPDTQPVCLVHRLDQDTSGLLLAAKSQPGYVLLQRQFSTRRVHKRYLACLQGPVVGHSGNINLSLRLDVNERPRQVVDPVLGKPALTRWQVLRRQSARTWVHLWPHTGRTHQLRVHCAHPNGLNAPIVGDRLYGTAGPRLCLHAEELGFHHPMSGAWMMFRVPAAFSTARARKLGR